MSVILDVDTVLSLQNEVMQLVVAGAAGCVIAESAAVPLMQVPLVSSKLVLSDPDICGFAIRGSRVFAVDKM